MESIHVLIPTKKNDQLSLMMLLTMMTVSLPALAQDEAKSLFQEGIAAFHAGDYPAALESFESSYSIRPMPKVLFNIAMCQKAMYRYTDALDTFNNFIETAKLPRRSPMYREVLSERSELLSKVGHITVISTPLDSQVLIDGTPIGNTPLTSGQPVDPGEHHVTVEKTGYRPFRRQVSIAGGTTLEIQAKLQPESGIVEIRCPHDVELLINGEQQESCPFIGKLSAKSHRMTLKKPGAAPIEQAFTLRPDERLLLDFSSPHTQQSLSMNTSPASRQTFTRNPLLLTVGGIASALAVGAGSLGAYFVIQWRKFYDQGLVAIDERDRDRYDTIVQERLPASRLGATISFITCGVLLGTGLTLILISKQDGEHAKKRKPALQIGFNRVELRF